MAGKSANLGNWSPGSPTTRYKVSGKNREFYTFENAPGLGAYATGGTIIDGGDDTFIISSRVMELLQSIVPPQ
jgi:hypothetical protein